MNKVKNECKIAKDSESIFRLIYDQMEKELAIEKQKIKIGLAREKDYMKLCN